MEYLGKIECSLFFRGPIWHNLSQVVVLGVCKRGAADQNRPKTTTPGLPFSTEGKRVTCRVDAGKGAGQRKKAATVAAPSTPAETKARFRTLRSVGSRVPYRASSAHGSAGAELPEHPVIGVIAARASSMCEVSVRTFSA
jgi:hypothetical protein